MKILMSLIILFSTFSYSEDITKKYSDLSKKFLTALSNNNSIASELALQQLDIDPSDSTALLRLSLTIREQQCKDIQSYFLQLGSRDEIQEIAQILMMKRCKY